MSAIIDNAKDQLILYGGLGNGGPSPPTPMNHNVYTLDLTKPPATRAWELRSTDRVVTSPWFTSTRGFIEVGKSHYLACDDTDDDVIYRFDKDTYQFTRLSASTLPPQHRAGDCCAVGVKIANSRDANDQGEERIYILGGRNNYASPVADVRYYSITYDRWERATDLNVGRSHLGCAKVMQNGQPQIYVIGGGNSTTGQALRSMEVYDVQSDKWTLYDSYLPDGRTRLAIANIDDKYLMLLGGDASCAGGGAGNLCTPDHPIRTVDLVDLLNGNTLISSRTHAIPQLQFTRATPATALRKNKNLYELYVIGGRTLATGRLDVTTSSEMLIFDRQMLESDSGHIR